MARSGSVETLPSPFLFFFCPLLFPRESLTRTVFNSTLKLGAWARQQTSHLRTQKRSMTCWKAKQQCRHTCYLQGRGDRDHSYLETNLKTKLSHKLEQGERILIRFPENEIAKRQNNKKKCNSQSIVCFVTVVSWNNQGVMQQD